MITVCVKTLSFIEMIFTPKFNQFKMSSYKVFLFCALVLNYHVSSDDYKNNRFRLNPVETLHRELTKNQFDHVQIIQENIPDITRNLLWEFGAVKKLEIEESQVRAIEEGSFSRMTSMKKLSLKHNLLKEIRNGIFSNLEIEELDLSDNQIKVIEEKAFDFMSNLKSIKLKNNKIEAYNNQWFVHVPDLHNINFENNLIKTLPSRVIGCIWPREGPVDVIFSHNQIEEIEEKAFDGYFGFYRLYLDHNAITTLPKNIFSNYYGIKHLRLDHNKIDCFTPKWKYYVKICNVDFNPWNPECLEAFKKGEEFSVDTTTLLPTTTTAKLPTRSSLDFSKAVKIG